MTESLHAIRRTDMKEKVSLVTARFVMSPFLCLHVYRLF